MTPAFAHALDAASSATIGWSFEPWIVLPLLLAALLYARGSARLVRRSRADRRVGTAIFWSGWVALALALVSPVHDLGTQVFAAHMVEHEILMVVAAPLLVAARPGAALLWGLPAALRPGAGAVSHSFGAVWRKATELWSATFLHAAVLWVWHLPALFHAALDSEAAHFAQHASFFGSALLFWSAVLKRRAEGHAGVAIVALFLTGMQAGLLGALLTFSQRLWYPFAADPFPVCGLTRDEDQALAGLVMWGPACMMYLIVALVLTARWISRLEARHA